MVTLDFSKCKTAEDVIQVFESNEEELSIVRKAYDKLRKQSL